MGSIDQIRTQGCSDRKMPEPARLISCSRERNGADNGSMETNGNHSSSTTNDAERVTASTPVDIISQDGQTYKVTFQADHMPPLPPPPLPPPTLPPPLSLHPQSWPSTSSFSDQSQLTQHAFPQSDPSQWSVTELPPLNQSLEDPILRHVGGFSTQMGCLDNSVMPPVSPQSLPHLMSKCGTQSSQSIRPSSPASVASVQESISAVSIADSSSSPISLSWNSRSPTVFVHETGTGAVTVDDGKKGSRKTPLTRGTREHARKIRSIGACQRCKILKKTV